MTINEKHDFIFFYVFDFIFMLYILWDADLEATGHSDWGVPVVTTWAIVLNPIIT